MTNANDALRDWPKVDPPPERDAALIALEEAWRNGALVENEPQP